MRFEIKLESNNIVDVSNSTKHVCLVAEDDYFDVTVKMTKEEALQLAAELVSAAKEIE
jgi:isopropylmalate/homocitrate/citramalate synthase